MMTDPLFETKWFNCDCYDAHHAVRFTYDKEYGDLVFEFRINNYKNFWQRLRAAFKYLFNADNKDCSYDSFIVRKDEAQAMITLLQKVVNNCKGVIPDTFIMCGEMDQYCSQECQNKAILEDRK